MCYSTKPQAKSSRRSEKKEPRNTRREFQSSSFLSCVSCVSWFGLFIIPLVIAQGVSSSLLHLRMHPRLAVRPAEEFVGFLVADDLPALGIPSQRAAQLQSDVRQDA